MGCSVSKIDSEESVARCKARKRFIKEAVQYRHAFAAAHAAYTVSLKNTGAALRQFGEGETKDNQVPSSPTAAFPPPPQPLLRPPPLPPASVFQPSPPPRQPLNLARAVSLPSLSLRSTGASPDRSPMMSPLRPLKEEEDESEYYADAPPPPPPPLESHAPPPPPPPPNPTWDFLDMFGSSQSPYQVHDTGTSEVQEVEYVSKTKATAQEDRTPVSKEEKQQEEDEEMEVVEEKAPQAEKVEENADPVIAEKKELQIIVPPKNKTGIGKELIQVLRELDDRFLAAFESGKDVTRMLEARKIHYHSNFADSNGITDHHAKVLSVISWSRSLSRTSLANEDANDSINDDEKDTHASTLDKLLAWEKKLYDEVKAGEVIRIELERKSTQLKNQKKREEDAATIDKTKAIVKSLQTKYLVEFQAVDSASLEVQKLRDDHMYLQLVELVGGLTKMWKTMLECHQQQYQMVGDMKTLDFSSAPDETSEFHRKNTLQLETEINLWHQNFEKLIATQKDYMNAVYSWLRLNIIQIESEAKDKLASPQKMVTPPIYHLCRAWLQALDQLPATVALQTIKGFSNIIHEMVIKQAEEVKQKKKHESLLKELEKKRESLVSFEKKYSDKHMDSQVPEENQDLAQGGANRNPLQERKTALETMKRRVEEEKEKHEKLCSQSYSMTISSLQSGLPPVLHAIAAFARACSETYAGLHMLTVPGNLPQNLQLGY